MPKIVFHRPGLSATRCLFIIIAFIALTNISILLNVPVLRPVLSFLLLAFLPGLLIIYILRQNRLVLTEKIVLSAGISMAFTIIFGLALAPILTATNTLIHALSSKEMLVGKFVVFLPSISYATHIFIFFSPVKTSSLVIAR